MSVLVDKSSTGPGLTCKSASMTIIFCPLARSKPRRTAELSPFSSVRTSNSTLYPSSRRRRSTSSIVPSLELSSTMTISVPAGSRSAAKTDLTSGAMLSRSWYAGTTIELWIWSLSEGASGGEYLAEVSGWYSCLAGRRRSSDATKAPAKMAAR